MTAPLRLMWPRHCGQCVPAKIIQTYDARHHPGRQGPLGEMAVARDLSGSRWRSRELVSPRCGQPWKLSKSSLLPAISS
jgi:hypothetical protein